MAQYIDKDALVAEIESYKSAAEWMLNGKTDLEHWRSQKGTCEKLLSFIDTLEVKEVGFDLGDPKGDKSAKYIIDTKTLEVKEVNLCKEEERIWKDFNMGERHLSKNDLEKISKHFFGLGMSVKNKEHKGE